MGRIDEIRELLKTKIRKDGVGTSTLLATVKSVDELEKTIVLDDEGLEIIDVRLRPVVDESEGLTVFPKPGTWCLAVRIEADDEWMAIAFGEVDKWRLKVGEAVIEQTGSGLSIANTGHSLKQVLTLIIEAVQKIVVTQGTNADREKLKSAQVKTNKIFK